jgi:hypothetical protein
MKALIPVWMLGAAALLPQAPQPYAQATREPAHANVLRVGPHRDLKRPSDAARVARDGDLIEIEATVYEADAAVWRQHHLTIRGVGGRAHLRADGAHAEGKAIWVIKGNDTTIEGVEFSGAKVPDQNGAGIRLEGAGLTVRDCYFHDNENGILTGRGPESDVVIERSEFAHNGIGDGYTHNLYIGHVRSFTLRSSYVHHAIVGHNVKSRAARNDIRYNRIMDEKDGSSSYAIDLPNGGLAFVVGNLIQQGPRTENPTIVSYGAEGLQYPANELYFVNNTVVNDLPAGGRFIFVREGTQVARLVNNLFAGRGSVLSGPGEPINNATVSRSVFVDAEAFDYRVRDSAVVIARGIDPGSVHGVELRALAQYAHKARTRPRGASAKPDLGALENRREP